MLERMRIGLALLVFVVPTSNAGAEEDERTAILAVIEQAYDAIRSGNPDDFRAIQLAEGTVLSFRPHPDGEPDKLEMRMARNSVLLEGLKPDGHEYIERWTNEPTLMIHGPIAVVWGEYEFSIDGEFSHCGTTALDFANVNGAWKIVNWMYTVERGSCPTDPSSQTQ